jgi:MoxR-like ATPase
MATISQITSAPVEPLSTDTNIERQVEFLKKVINNMVSGSSRKLLIGGDTGIGKTSFAKQFAKILGMPIVVIEIPHIVEEELINIPYIVYDAVGGSREGIEKIEKIPPPDENGVRDIKVVLAKSWLASNLASINKMPNDPYKKFVETKLDPNSKKLLEKYLDEYPDDIETVRSMYDRILFFDEFFRQSTPTIKNILRNVLNGQIGNDKIPDGTYTMYASNLSDAAHGAIDPQLGNEEYDQPEFKPPTAREWLDYTVGTAGVEWHNEVVEAFKNVMTDEAVSYKDANTKIRTSPRRWSDTMVYVNTLYPFGSARDAGIAQLVLRRQFQDEQGKTSKAYEILDKILNELIKKSGHKEIPSVSAQDWQEVLLQNVMVKQKAGESKKYIPVIQGAPGIGKTSVVYGFEGPPYNMRVIPITASTLSPDSITGLPTTTLKDKEGKKLEPDEMETHFSEPPLYLDIHKKIKMAELGYYKELVTKQKEGKLGNKTAKDVFKEFKSQPYKYVIFFDEINRVPNVRTFNSIRRLILEKEFNSRYKLPSDAIIIAAMNPSDIGKSVIGLTDHFRDAIDLIDVEPKWETTVSYLKDSVVPKLKNAEYKPSDEAIDLALELIKNFPKQFADKHITDDQGNILKTHIAPEFYINVGGIHRPYMSPRAYTDTFKSLTAALDGQMKFINRKLNAGKNLSDDEINQRLTETAKESFMDYFRNLFFKERIDPIGFPDQLESYIETHVIKSLKQERTKASIGSMLDLAINDETNSLANNPDFIVYMEHEYNPADFTEDFGSYLEQKIGEAGGLDKIEDYVMKFFATRDRGSFYHIYQEINQAIVKHNITTDILDRVTDLIKPFYLNAVELFKMDDSKIDQMNAIYFKIRHEDEKDEI